MESEISRKELGTRTGEALVGEMSELAHIDIAIGQKGGAFETAFSHRSRDAANGSYCVVGNIGSKLCRQAGHAYGKQKFRLRAKRKLSLCSGQFKPR